VVPWLAVAVVVQVAALEVVRRTFVGTARGQLLDSAALAGNVIGQRHVEGLVETVLGALTVASLAATTVAIGFVALARGRVLLAGAAVLLVAGANLTTQLLKSLVHRPELGVDVERAAAGNSLPSGHTTVAASVAVALVLVLPPRLRGLAALVGAGYAALAGVATVSAGWHRPSDVVASLLVVGAWTAVAGVLIGLLDRGGGGPDPAPHRFALAVLVATGLALLAVAAVTMVATDRVLPAPAELLSRGRLLTAYAGSAAGIAGVTCLVSALALTTGQLTVPAREREPGPGAGPRAGHPARRPPAPVRPR
jgi:membrane-associated phospholipid phosphatase